jgi:hypothetical protein
MNYFVLNIYLIVILLVLLSLIYSGSIALYVALVLVPVYIIAMILWALNAGEQAIKPKSDQKNE